MKMVCVLVMLMKDMLELELYTHIVRKKMKGNEKTYEGNGSMDADGSHDSAAKGSATDLEVAGDLLGFPSLSYHV